MRYGRTEPGLEKTDSPLFRDRGSPSDCVAKGEHDTLLTASDAFPGTDRGTRSSARADGETA